jgi:hypothetical protein
MVAAISLVTVSLLCVTFIFLHACKRFLERENSNLAEKKRQIISKNKKRGVHQLPERSNKTGEVSYEISDAAAESSQGEKVSPDYENQIKIVDDTFKETDFGGIKSLEQSHE